MELEEFLRLVCEFLLSDHKTDYSKVTCSLAPQAKDDSCLSATLTYLKVQSQQTILPSHTQALQGKLPELFNKRIVAVNPSRLRKLEERPLPLDARMAARLKFDKPLRIVPAFELEQQLINILKRTPLLQSFNWVLINAVLLPINDPLFSLEKYPGYVFFCGLLIDTNTLQALSESQEVYFSTSEVFFRKAWEVFQQPGSAYHLGRKGLKVTENIQGSLAFQAALELLNIAADLNHPAAVFESVLAERRPSSISLRSLEEKINFSFQYQYLRLHEEWLSFCAVKYPGSISQYAEIFLQVIDHCIKTYAISIQYYLSFRSDELKLAYCYAIGLKQNFSDIAISEQFAQAFNTLKIAEKTELQCLEVRQDEKLWLSYIEYYFWETIRGKKAAKYFLSLLRAYAKFEKIELDLLCGKYILIMQRLTSTPLDSLNKLTMGHEDNTRNLLRLLKEEKCIADNDFDFEKNDFVSFLRMWFYRTIKAEQDEVLHEAVAMLRAVWMFFVKKDASEQDHGPLIVQSDSSITFFSRLILVVQKFSKIPEYDKNGFNNKAFAEYYFYIMCLIFPAEKIKFLLDELKPGTNINEILVTIGNNFPVEVTQCLYQDIIINQAFSIKIYGELFEKISIFEKREQYNKVASAVMAETLQFSSVLTYKLLERTKEAVVYTART